MRINKLCLPVALLAAIFVFPAHAPAKGMDQTGLFADNGKDRAREWQKEMKKRGKEYRAREQRPDHRPAFNRDGRPDRRPDFNRDGRPDFNPNDRPGGWNEPGHHPDMRHGQGYGR